MSTRMTLASVAALLLLAVPAQAAQGPPPITPDRVIASDLDVELQSNETREIALPIAGLGRDANVLMPCFGFSISGPGVELAAANIPTFGTVVPEDPSKPDGGIPGAVREPDGSFTFAPPTGLTVEELRYGVSCKRVGWSFYGADGKPALDAYGNPKPAKEPTSAAAARKAKAASKRKRNAARRVASRKLVARQAVDGAVKVTLAGVRRADGQPTAVVVQVTTGQLSGRTVASLHARVLKQEPIAPRADAPAR